MWINNLEIENFLKENNFNNEVIETIDIFNSSINNTRENIFEIDMQDKIENNPRENLKMKKITEFQEIENLDNFKEILDKIIKKLISNTKYNTIERLEKLVDNIKNGESMVETLSKINFSNHNRDKWTNCVWLSKFLIEELKKIWIKAYVIRFDAGWFIDNDYITYWHSATIIPIKNNWKKFFILADLWIFIPEWILFEYDGENEVEINWKNIKIRKESKIDLEYLAEINWKKFYFDPYNEWLNPEETLSKDTMRWTWKYKITKQDENWKINYKFLLDIKNNIISLEIEGNKIELSFEDFLEIQKNKNIYNLYKKLINILWEDEIIFLEKIKKIIIISENFKNEIWTKKTKLLSNKK